MRTYTTTVFFEIPPCFNIKIYDRDNTYEENTVSKRMRTFSQNKKVEKIKENIK